MRKLRAIPSAVPNEPGALVVVLGPTASGKSSLALDLAERFGGAIVNCDSVQVYRHFDIGTAKTPPAQWRAIPHFLIDIADPLDSFTAGDYARAARAALQEISEHGQVPIVVGGTGLYLRALLEGLFAGPVRNPDLRQELSTREVSHPGVLHRFLRRLDAVAAARIHPNDVKKLIRAIEVCLTARQPMTQQFATGRDPLAGYRILRIGLDPPRAELYRRVDQRVVGMFESGLTEEVRGILSMGYPRSARPFQSLGYKEALGIVEGRLTPAEAIAQAQKQTRHYAKRQMTWFRREPEVHWLHGFGDDPEIVRQAMTLVARQIP